MTNNLTLALVFVFLLAAVLGCSSINPFAEQKPANRPASNRAASNSANSTPAANKSLSDQAVDTALGVQKLGIPECDALMDDLTAYANNPEDGFAEQLAKSLVANQIKSSVKTAVEENQTDKAQLATICKSLKAEFEKTKAGTAK